MLHRKKILALLAGGLLSVCGAPVYSAQVCTTETVGKEEFRGISGSSDNNVIAVGKKGTIYRYDGTSWNLMPAPTDDELNDVEVLANDVAFAVGKNGLVLQLSGGVWTSISGAGNGFTKQDLLGVWAASPTEVYAAGKKGEIWFYDGSSWSDQSNAANTENKEITDIWGYAYGVYAINDKGVLYSYDRVAGTWLAPDSVCEDAGDKFEDLWGDSKGNLYLAGKDGVYLYDGSSCDLIGTTDGEDLLGISGWTQEGRVVAVGKKGTVHEYDGSTWTETQTSTKKDLLDDWVSKSGNAYYAGKNDQLTVCQCSDCPPPSSSLFLITHDSYGINCQDEVIQVQLFDSVSGTPIIDYSEEVTLDTQSGFGSWSPLLANGNFSDTTLNDGLATYDWPLGEFSASFTLAYREGPATIDVDAYQTNTPGIRDTDTEGSLLFSPSGFTLTDTALSNPPPAVIAPFSAPLVAGTEFPIHIAAYGVTPNDPTCGIIESYTGPKNLKFWQGFMNPVSGSVAVTVDGAGIPAAEAAAVDQAVSFTSGQAVVTGKYKDVGLIQISVKDDSQPHPDLPNGIRGATAGFVVKPYQFVLSNIEDTAANPNPAAVDAGGAAFVAAGEAFSATVSSIDAEGDVTPNYGQETIPETVRLTTTLVAPAVGDNPPVGGSGFGAFSSGQATGTTFSWPEVGIVTLTPSIGDGDYLGAGDVSGTASGNVGRFYAHHFAAALNTPTFSTSCPAGSFSYIGETFGYSNPPVITLTAQALAGEITENYSGDFFKLDNASLPNPVYSSTPATLNTSGLPAVDPLIADTGAGTGTLTFSSGSGLSYTRGSEEPPFDADIRLSMDVVDTDGAAASNPIVFGAAGGIIFDSGAEMRYGRGAAQNAYGSELVNLSVPFRTEYFLNATTGFVQNVDDSCTSPLSVSFGAFTDNLNDGETCVIDSGFPGISGAGCATPGAPALRFRSPPLAGDFNLHLQAPGENNDGSTTITVDMPDWLEFDWNTATPGFEDPSATAVFGIFRGTDRRIYIRELY